MAQNFRQKKIEKSNLSALALDDVGHILESPKSAYSITGSFSNNYWWTSGSQSSLGAGLFSDGCICDDEDKAACKAVFGNNFQAFPEITSDYKNVNYGEFITDYKLVNGGNAMDYFLSRFSSYVSNIRNTTLSVLCKQNNKEVFKTYYGIGIIKDFSKDKKQRKPIVFAKDSNLKTIQIKENSTIVTDAISDTASNEIEKLKNGVVKRMLSKERIDQVDVENLNTSLRTISKEVCTNRDCLFTFPPVLPKKRTYNIVYHHSQYLGNKNKTETDTVEVYSYLEYRIAGAEKLTGIDKTCFDFLPNKGWLLGDSSKPFVEFDLNPDFKTGDLYYLRGDKAKYLPSGNAEDSLEYKIQQKAKERKGSSYNYFENIDTRTEFTIHLYPACIPVYFRFHKNLYTKVAEINSSVGQSKTSDYKQFTHFLGETVTIPGIGGYNYIGTDVGLVYTSESIQNFFQNNAKCNFNGYAKSSNSETVNYVPGNRIYLDPGNSTYLPSNGTVKVLNFYPIFNFYIQFGLMYEAKWKAVHEFEAVDSWIEKRYKNIDNQAITPVKNNGGDTDPKNPNRVRNTSTNFKGIKIKDDICIDFQDSDTMSQLGIPQEVARNITFKNIKKLRFVITGFINEQIHSHAPDVWGGFCRIYLYDIKACNEKVNPTINQSILGNYGTSYISKYVPKSYGYGDIEGEPKKSKLLFWWEPKQGENVGSGTWHRKNVNSEELHRIKTDDGSRSKDATTCLFEYSPYNLDYIKEDNGNIRTFHADWRGERMSEFTTGHREPKYSDLPQIHCLWEKNGTNNNIDSLHIIRFQFMRKEKVNLDDSTKAGSNGSVFIGAFNIVL